MGAISGVLGPEPEHFIPEEQHRDERRMCRLTTMPVELLHEIKKYLTVVAPLALVASLSPMRNADILGFLMLSTR